MNAEKSCGFAARDPWDWVGAVAHGGRLPVLEAHKALGTCAAVEEVRQSQSATGVALSSVRVRWCCVRYRRFRSLAVQLLVC